MCFSFVFVFFFFKQKTAYEMRISDWSSDVCSSDLIGMRLVAAGLLALSLASCDLFGERGPVRIAAIGPLNAAANPINGELSTTNAALPEATSQGLGSYDGAGEIDVGLAERWAVTTDARSNIIPVRQARAETRGVGKRGRGA